MHIFQSLLQKLVGAKRASCVRLQTKHFTLLSGPTNAALNGASGVFTFRPIVSQANSSTNVTIVVTDNGSPNLSATQTFTVTVNPLNRPSVGPVSAVGGAFSLTVSGDTGPDYAVQASTNLMNWATIFSTNSPAMPFQFTDPAAGLAARFYRIIVGPPLP